MKAKVGMVVKAIAGKECGRLFAVVKADEKYIFIADGKKRKLQSPKRKNPKHLRSTDHIVDINDITDKKLRIVLGNLSTP